MITIFFFQCLKSVILKFYFCKEILFKINSTKFDDLFGIKIQVSVCVFVSINPWTEEPGRLQSMGSLRVRHD